MNKEKWNKYLPDQRYDNISEMIIEAKNRFCKKPAIRWIKSYNNSIQTLSYDELVDSMKTIFYGLDQMGFKKDDHLAICSENRPEWILADLGIQALGGVTVTVYPSLKAKEMEYILKDSECKAIFVDTIENLEKIKSVRDNLPELQVVIIFKPRKLINEEGGIISFDELLELGTEQYHSSNRFFSSVKKIKEDDLSNIIYTSGTTGVPKGVMLSHKNFLSDALASVSVAMTLKKGIIPYKHRFLSILPYSHSFGKTVAEYAPLMVGATIDIVSELTPEAIRNAFEKFRPTLMAGIPYVYQKIYEIVLEELSSYPSFIKNLVEDVIENGKKYYENIRQGKKNKIGTILKHKILGKIVGKRITKELGGNWELMISGSAAISKDLIYFFNTLGIPLLEGYGLTEASPVTHLTRTEYNSDFRPTIKEKINPHKKTGTVGPPIEIIDNPYKNMDQKVDPKSKELLIRGPMVMQGYWKKPSYTNNAIDKDGWLHTGDVVEIDKHGYATIKGRNKLIIKLATGKMISPAAIETKITPTSRIIAQFLLVGDDTRNYLTAIIVPYQEPLKEYAEENDIPYETWEDLITNETILSRIKEEIETLLQDTSDYARPKKFIISSEAFTDQRYITPTYKFKRSQIYADFQEAIDTLYNLDHGEEFLVLEDRLTNFYDQSMIIS